MIYPSIDKLLKVVDSKYKLVHVAANRSYQMTKDAHFQMKAKDYKSEKNVGKALEEVAEGLIHIE